jgi:hypothetical protein
MNRPRIETELQRNRPRIEKKAVSLDVTGCNRPCTLPGYLFGIALLIPAVIPVTPVTGVTLG